MAAQKGRDLLLKIDNGAGAFVTIAGLRTQRLALNADPVDITLKNRCLFRKRSLFSKACRSPAMREPQ